MPSEKLQEKTKFDQKNGSVRSGGRLDSQLRPIGVRVGEFGFSDGSVLFSLGKTKVLCSVTLLDGVPSFLKGKKTGWLTAEYAMLPCATNKRTPRESSAIKRNSRSVEISRLIGRCMRAVCDLSVLGERTVQIDCDVVQADGGTRVSAISGSSLALGIAQQKWLDKGLIKQPVLKNRIAAVSVVIKDGAAILDASQEEDNGAQADFNFVMSQSKEIVEIQGTCEQGTLPWDKFCQMKVLAESGTGQIIDFCSQFIPDKS